MKQTFTLIGLIAVIGLVFFGCPTEGGTTPQEHTGTITAFGKTINVKGDASISKANFETAKGKVQEAMTTLSADPEMLSNLRDKFNNMVNRSGFEIIIGIGNAGPDADAKKSMTIGVNYLLNNDTETTIIPGIVHKVTLNAFEGV